MLSEVTFDLQDTSVSVPGSLLTLTGVGTRTPVYRRGGFVDGVYLRCIRTRDMGGMVFRLLPTYRGEPLPDATWVGTPGCATVRHGAHWLTIRFAGPRELLVEGHGLGLFGEGYPGYFDWIRALPNKRWRYHAGSCSVLLDLIPLDCALTVDAPWEAVHSTRVHIDLRPGNDGHCQLLLRERAPQGLLFDDGPIPADWDAESAFLRWADPLIAGLPDRATALCAAHVLWAHQAGPDGLLPGRAIIAGKSWMVGAWGWDQCFCAAGIVHADPELAWEQLSLFFRLQGNDGRIPPYLHPEREYWYTMMPPLQGWCLRRLRATPGCVTPERLAWITPRLDAFVRWWLYRDEDGDGAPEYYHGNDSGWDNGTSFMDGVPVASPDLLVYLAECCTCLVECATALGDRGRAAYWQAQEARLIDLLSTRFVQHDRLVARRSPGGEIPGGDSLLPWIGLRAGMRLPDGVRSAAIDALGDPARFLAPYGLATESLSSPYLTPDGYWRGPVWAPSTWLLAEALEMVGAVALAREILQRFCLACAQDGMAENFDPHTGKGLRDRSYSWTAAVYILAQRHLQGI